jgi:hypothetical protein
MTALFWLSDAPLFLGYLAAVTLATLLFSGEANDR